MKVLGHMVHGKVENMDYFTMGILTNVEVRCMIIHLHVFYQIIP